jgi:hypothetical protein
VVRIELKDGKLVSAGGRVFERKYGPAKDNGRPEANQAGLPPTKGLISREGKKPDRRGTHMEYQGSGQTILTTDQQASDKAEGEIVGGQQAAGEEYRAENKIA